MSRLILLLLLTLSYPAAQTLRYVGTAYTPKPGQAVYTESYTEHYSAAGKLESGAEQQHTIIAVTEPVVADAGFNPFMREHLPQLTSGKPVTFHFLNPARLTWFRFTARAMNIQHQRIHVRIAPANTFLNWLVPSIDLRYAEQDGRLMQYNGLTNISLQGSKTISARSEYEYRAHQTSALCPFHETLEYWLTSSEG